MIHECGCEGYGVNGILIKNSAIFQNNTYGPNKRIHTISTKAQEIRCTVCGKSKPLPSKINNFLPEEEKKTKSKRK